MTDDPHDGFDGWRWSCTAHVSESSDPCDEWPHIYIGGKAYLCQAWPTYDMDHVTDALAYGLVSIGKSLRSFGTRLGQMVIACDIDHFRDELPLIREEPASLGYDYSRHDPTRSHKRRRGR